MNKNKIIQKIHSKVHLSSLDSDAMVEYNLFKLYKVLSKSHLYFDSIIRKPWGFEINISTKELATFKNAFFLDHIITDYDCGKIMFMKPISSLSWHYHPNKDANVKLLHGEASFKGSYDDIEPEFFSVEDLDHLVRIPKNVRHRITAGTMGAIVAELSSGSDDGTVRLTDEYGRV